ncbi:ABC transporter permease, partial [Verminephrobacter eiseniae]|nr:ABC transporter permease [Verminephrobacter eiseniae]
MNAARPPEGVHTAAEGEGTPASAANGASAEPMVRLRDLGVTFSGSGGGKPVRAISG